MARKQEAENQAGYASMQSPLETALTLTTDTPLLAVGRVVKRTRLSGKTDRGPWELFQVELRGNSGSTITVTINDAKKAPAVGEAACFCVFVDRSGRLRESKDFGETF